MSAAILSAETFISGPALIATQPLEEPPAGPSTHAQLLLTLERRRAQLIRVALRMTRCEQDAEDIVQESALKAFANLSRFRAESRMDTWLHAIVVNTARSWLRLRRHHAEIPLEAESSEDGNPLPLDLPHPGEDPEEFCRRSEMQQLLFAEIGSLDPKYGLPIRLCDLDQRSYREAASALHLSDSALKARLFRARILLRNRLAQHGSAPGKRRLRDRPRILRGKSRQPESRQP